MPFVPVVPPRSDAPVALHVAVPVRTPRRLRRSCRVCAHPRAALSGPERPRFGIGRTTAASPASPSAQNEHEYHAWSPDFLELCSAQLQLLCATTRTSHAELFFRRENCVTGALEFVPLVARSPLSEDDARRVWIASPINAGQTELEGPLGSTKYLPGGIPAQWLLPHYPFIHPSAGGETLPDGRLCVPVEYNGVLAGTIVLVPENPARLAPQAVWDQDAVQRATTVAKTIALAAAMEGRWHASIGALDMGNSLMQSMRLLLRTTLHQIRSPVSALVTFGHLMLRKFPPGNSNRALAKNMILEALRVDELLQPLDDAGKAPLLPEAEGMPVPWYEREDESSVIDVDKQTSSHVEGAAAFGSETSSNGMQMLWISDVLTQQIDVYQALVEANGMGFHATVDDDSPPVMAIHKFVKESIRNLLENAIKYSSPGAHIGVSSFTRAGSTEESNEDGGVTVVVWDTGFGFMDDEIDDVWLFESRGTAAEKSGRSGTGIGLSSVRKMIIASGASVSLQSPLPSFLDPRDPDTRDPLSAPGSAFFIDFNRALSR